MTNTLEMDLQPDTINIETFIMMMTHPRTDFMVEGIIAMDEMVAALYFHDIMQTKRELEAGRCDSKFYQENMRAVNCITMDQAKSRYLVHLHKAIRLTTTLNSRFAQLTGDHFILRKIDKREDGEFCPFDSLRFICEFRDAFNDVCNSLDFESVNWLLWLQEAKKVRSKEKSKAKRTNLAKAV